MRIWQDILTVLGRVVVVLFGCTMLYFLLIKPLFVDIGMHHQTQPLFIRRLTDTDFPIPLIGWGILAICALITWGTKPKRRK